MKATHRRRVLLILLLCTSGSATSAPPESASESPHVLLIMVDDLRPMLGCYGDAQIQTPHIDRLAAGGMVFERAYCQYAKCGTSRLSMLTGLRPDAIGVFSNNVRDVNRFRKDSPKHVSFAQWFKTHGYHTRGFGKIYHDGWDDPADWSLPPSPGREREMLEVVNESDPQLPTEIADRLKCPVLQSPDVPDNHLFAGRMTERVVQVMSEPPADRRSLLAVGFRRPHLPFVAPKRYFDMYRFDVSRLAKNPRPSPAAPLLGWFNSDGYGGTARRQGPPMPTDPSRQEAMDWNGYEMRSYLGVPNSGAIDGKTQLALCHAYAACVSYVDVQIGRLLAARDASPYWRNSVVVICSDHGWHLGEHSAWGKMTNYEVATRVPLIIAGPGIRAGRTASIAELVDLYPTICDLADVPRPSWLEGQSLLPVLTTGRSDHEATGLSQYQRFAGKYMGRTVRTARYRYVEWTESQSGRIVARELYDHEKDAAETVNLAVMPQYDDLTAELQLRLTAGAGTHGGSDFRP